MEADYRSDSHRKTRQRRKKKVAENSPSFLSEAKYAGAEQSQTRTVASSEHTEPPEAPQLCCVCGVLAAVSTGNVKAAEGLSSAACMESYLLSVII